MLTIVETSNPQGNPSGLEKGEIKQSLLRKDSPAVGKQRPGNQGGGECGSWQVSSTRLRTSVVMATPPTRPARSLFPPPPSCRGEGRWGTTVLSLPFLCLLFLFRSGDPARDLSLAFSGFLVFYHQWPWADSSGLGEERV